MNKLGHNQDRSRPGGLNCRIGNSFTLPLKYQKDFSEAVTVSSSGSIDFTVKSEKYCRIKPVKYSTIGA